MSVDNSGPTFVFGEKTKEAIEEGKNRVTLLQVEEQRLGKLKRTLESDIVKLEADIEYKKSLQKTAIETLDKLDVTHKTMWDSVEQANKQLDEINLEIEGRIRAIEEREMNCSEREKDILAREESLDERFYVLNKQENAIKSDQLVIDEKKSKLEQLIKEL